MLKCKFCSKPPDVYVSYARLYLCRDHFIRFYEKRILKVMKKMNIRNMRLLIAVSGGKDSLALLKALNSLKTTLNLDLSAIFIDLGIPRYSDISKKLVKETCRKLDVNLIIYDIKKELGYSIPELVSIIKNRPCSVCGIVKRWVLNKIAIEENFDYIATGHNLDDFSTLVYRLLLTQQLDQIKRFLSYKLPPNHEVNMAGRIRPQIYVRERDNLLYCIFNNIEFVDIECPLAKGRESQIFYKELWNEIINRNPSAQINFVKSLMKLMKHYPEESINIKKCKKCGFPTAAEDSICVYCKISNKFYERKRQKSILPK